MVSQTGCCLLGLCLLPLLLAPAAAQAVAPVALPPLSAIEGGSATVASQMDLPATVQELCANVSLPAAAAPNGFTQASVGPLQRLNTTTASWGYHRFGNASSPRPPLVMLPGFGATVDTFRASMLAALAARQELILVDNRGQGHTIDLAPDEPLTVPGMANDTMELIRALDLPAPPNVLGLSMGGFIATALAALHGQELGKIVAVAGSAGGEGATPPSDAATRTLTSPGRGDVQGLALFFPLDTPEGVRAACEYAAEPPAVPSPRNLTTTQRQLAGVVDYLLRDDTVWDALPTAPNPVLVVAGGRDDTVPPANQRAIAERAPAPWLVTYPDAAHGAFLQHAASLLPVLDAFLAGDAGQLA